MRTRLVVLSLLLTSGSFLFVRCSEKKKTTRPASVDTALAQALEPPVGIPEGTGTGSNDMSRTTGVKGWRYEKTKDKAGAPVFKASINGTNLLQFDYPYAGGSTATLTIRQGTGEPQVYIDVTKGQFNRSFQEGKARIQADANPPVTYTLSAAANGRANIIFIDGAGRLIRQLKTARSLQVQIQFAGQPTRSIEFSTSGLQWKR
ncbi:hypothetical protein [Spirosoma utsteinense]|uniref:DUF4251 domain-containing protein n=1 Tax=Spirosoma utsteinense TaxID=2585773 RepID=A0ABR6W7L6_9BACT|nr:hypothetical protein [Spirosoma utsteinense]MBC3787543.1 hypothetical protein [Spirosoma utsteinense]MBC3792229.1 hypothetical protein [Spirosoma utsteinense]